MKLYLILASNDDESLELFVSARDQLQAFTLWRDYYYPGVEFGPEECDAVDLRICVVPVVSETARTHEWWDEVEVREFHGNIPMVTP
jgi:hypothetical protein